MSYKTNETKAEYYNRIIDKKLGEERFEEYYNSVSNTKKTDKVDSHHESKTEETEADYYTILINSKTNIPRAPYIEDIWTNEFQKNYNYLWYDEYTMYDEYTIHYPIICEKIDDSTMKEFFTGTIIKKYDESENNDSRKTPLLFKNEQLISAVEVARRFQEIDKKHLKLAKDKNIDPSLLNYKNIYAEYFKKLVKTILEALEKEELEKQQDSESSEYLRKLKQR